MDQLTKSKESFAFYRCAPLVVALCLIMVAGCCSTSNRPKFLQRLQNREEVDSRVNDSQKDSPSKPSDPLKEKETVGSRSLTAGTESGDRSQYVDNAAAKDTSNSGGNQTVNTPYRSYAPSVDQADRQPTLNDYQIHDPTPLSTQGIPQTAQTIEASQTQPASEPLPEPAPVASEPQESTPAPEPEPTPAPEPRPSESEASSVPTPPVVSDPEPSPEPQPKEQESSVPTPPTTFEPASVKTEQPIAQDQADAEPQTPEQVEAAAPVTSGLQGDATIGDLAKEATANAESPESAEPASSEASAPEAVPAEAPAPAAEAAPVETPEPAAEPAPVDSTDDSNWEQKYSANKTGRNVQLKNAVYSRVRSGNAKSSGSVKTTSTAQRVEVPKTASVVVERVAPIVPVQSNVVTKTEEYVDASKYRGRRVR